MTKQDRQGRLIAAAVFVSLVFIWGSGYETFPIFFPALLKYFGWSKARLGLMSTGFSMGFVPSVLVAGWPARPNRGALGDGDGSDARGRRLCPGKPLRFVFHALRR